MSPASLKGLLGRYEFTDGDRSDKFWSVEYSALDGTYTTKWGKNGLPAQGHRHGLSGTEAFKKINEKISKGYVLVGKKREEFFEIKKRSAKPIPKKPTKIDPSFDFYAELERAGKGK